MSNVYSANSIPVKFRSLGIKAEDRDTLLTEEIEVMAEVEHNRWNVEKLLNGFAALPYQDREAILRGLLSPDKEEYEAAKARRNHLKNTLFQHADITPYDELSPGSRQYDIDIVANLLDVIKAE